MAEQQGFYITVDGQEVAISDFINVGRTAGLATDRLFANLIQMPSFDGTNIYKSAFLIYAGYPEGASPSTPQDTAIVIPDGATGSVLINPFCAVIGTRLQPPTSPTDPTWTSSRAAVSDIRTAVWTGPSSYSAAQAIAANSSGNPRWDLVYATVSVDTAAGSVVRREKSPSTGSISTASLPTYLANPVTVGVVTGTPGASPAIPALPADSGGNYNVALAAVRVPNGFTSTSTVATQDIRDQVGNKNLTNGGGQTVTALASSVGAMSGPSAATGNNDRAATYATNFPYTGTGGQRPGMFLPPGLIGGTQILVEVDETSSSVSHANGAVIDDSIDWRNRFIMTFMTADGAQKFANDPTVGGQAVPQATGLGVAPAFQIANSMVASLGGGLALIFNTSIYSGIGGGSLSEITVNMTTGKLQWKSNGTISGVRLFFWIMASAQFPNL